MSTIESSSVSIDRGGRRILHAADFSVGASQFVGIAGPNGSGKSTLLRALSGIWPASEGAVLLDGIPLERRTRREIARAIAYVPQEVRFDFGFTVREIVAMGRHPHRSRFAAANPADRAAVERAIETCDIGHLVERTVSTLSGGERQRVSIARGLASEPRFLLLDEPTASLDVEHALEIFALCQRLASAGCGIALCTHDLNNVVRFAESVVLMRAGSIVWNGRTSDILDADTIGSVFGVKTELVRSVSGKPILIFHQYGKV